MHDTKEVRDVLCETGCGVGCLGLGVWRLAIRVQGVGFWIKGLGLRVWVSGFRVQGLGSRIQGLRFRV